MGYIIRVCTYDCSFYVWDKHVLHECVRMITGFTYGIYYTRVYVRLQVLCMGYITRVCTYDYRFYVWDILHACVRKMTKLVTQLQQDVEDMKDRKEEADNKASDGLEVDEDVPSDEQIESMEEKLETAQSDQKNLFLIIFQVCV